MSVEITLESNIVLSELKDIQSLTGADHVNLVFGDTLKLIGSGKDVAVSKTIPFEGKGKGKYTVNAFVLSNILKGRSKVTLSCKEDSNKMKFVSSGKGRKYSGDFVMPPFKEDIQIKTGDHDNMIKINEKEQRTILEAIKWTTISDIYHGNPSYVFVNTGKRLKVTSFDEPHLAYAIRNIKSKHPTSFCIPMSMLDTISKLTKGKAYSMAISGGSIYVENELFALNAPITQMNSELTFELAQQFVKKLDKGEYFMEIPVSTLVTTLDNMCSVWESGAYVTISGEGEGVTFSTITSFGKVKETIKCKSKWKSEVKIDPKLLLDLLRSVPTKTIKLCCIKDKNLFFKVEPDENSTVCYSCTLL